jgi:hypothetical protein
MQSKLIAMVASSIVALAALLGMPEAVCMLRECLRDDASFRGVVDGSFFNTAGHVVPWLATSWFLGGVLALTLWPNPSIERTASGLRPPAAAHVER